MMTWDEENMRHALGIPVPSSEELAAMNRRAVENFNAHVAKAEAEETEIKIRQLLGDTLGHRTYMVTVERG